MYVIYMCVCMSVGSSITKANSKMIVPDAILSSNPVFMF